MWSEGVIRGSRAKPTSSSMATSRNASYADAASLRASPAGCATPTTEGRARLRFARRRAVAAVRLPAFFWRGLLGRRRGAIAAGQFLPFLRRELLVFLPLLRDLLPLF